MVASDTRYRFRHIRVLDALSELADKDFIGTDNAGASRLVEAFFKVIPEINAHLGKIVGALDTGAYEFGQLRKHVTYYLQEGIVPSTITIEVDKGETEQAIPSSVALLNCFACFYLEHIEKLMARVEGHEAETAEKRVYWTRKLESWTSKALEDIALLGEP